MRRIRVVTDSTADMGDGDAERLGIEIVPLSVLWNGATYRDKVDITIDEFYRKLREEQGTPKTSQPSAGDFETVYRRLLEDADGIVSVHISGKLSGTVNSAQIAAHNVAPDRITVIDSLTTAFCLGMLARRVAQVAGDGGSLPECTAVARDMVPRLSLFCVFDTLEFLRRGGRIGRVQAITGSLLAVKPITQLVRGELVPVDRVRTRAAAAKRTAELVSDVGPLEELVVLYGDVRESAEQLRDMLLERNLGVEVKWGRIGAVIGAHTGPGVFGACFLKSK